MSDDDKKADDRARPAIKPVLWAKFRAVAVLKGISAKALLEKVIIEFLEREAPRKK